MSGIGTGYDLSASTYSPDGRIFQVEYAQKAVEASGTCIGIRTKDGVVLACERLVHSKLLVPGAHSNRRIQTADVHIGLASAGLQADARHITLRARDEASSYRDNYRAAIPGKVIAERLALYFQAYTTYSVVRPFGVSTLLAVMDPATKLSSLWAIEPSGLHYGYFGAAAGKGKQAAKTELEKLPPWNDLTARQAVKEAARIIYAIHDDVKDKEFELELSWVCEESNGKHAFVPKDLHLEAEQLAKAALNPDNMEED